MIKTYILYSYGMVGYQTYLVTGQENEAMNKGIADSEMPRGSLIFFGKQDYAKMVLKHIDDGQMTLFIEKVPSPHTDPLGRNIPCSIQFIGNAEEDGDTLRRLAVHIGSDFTAFGDFFQKLISDRGGLHIFGDKLKEYISGISQVEMPNSKNAEDILKSKKAHGVIFLSPYCNPFKIRDSASRQVMEQLNLSAEDMKSAVIIPAKELENKLNSQDENLMPKPDESSEKNFFENEKLREENEEHSQQIREMENLKKEVALLKETVSMYKREYGNIQKRQKILLLVVALSIMLNAILLIRIK